MKSFLAEDFMLPSVAAGRLYEMAERLPIFDFHNHLSAQEIYDDRRYGNLAELWLSGDHYKWRAMRAWGVPESQITGDAPDYEKFQAWAGTVPYLIGNPLYHWTHMELVRYFGCTRQICPEEAEAIWKETGERLKSPEYSTRKLLESQRVAVLCTTDDPADSLEYHRKLREEGYSIRVCPTFRPDQALGIEKPGFAAYIGRLAESCGREIASFAELVAALESRLEYFIRMGCMASDHSLEQWIYQAAQPEEAERAFGKRMAGEELSDQEIGSFRSCLLAALGRMYAQTDTAMQIHIGALRNQCGRLFRSAGADVGCDGMRDTSYVAELAGLLDMLDADGSLPRTILFGLNPKQTEALAVLAASFAGEGAVCRVQIGPAWWFSDNKQGMEAQLTSFANQSLPAGFVGMATDSRSFLSFPRHEYFRRILCGMLGEWVEQGLYPADWARLEEIVGRICYHNAESFFHFRG